MCAMLQAQYHHPHLHMYIEQFKCNEYQHAKTSGPSHGLLPDQDIADDPQEEVAVAIIAPWPATTPQGIVEFLP